MAKLEVLLAGATGYMYSILFLPCFRIYFLSPGVVAAPFYPLSWIRRQIFLSIATSLS